MKDIPEILYCSGGPLDGLSLDNYGDGRDGLEKGEDTTVAVAMQFDCHVGSKPLDAWCWAIYERESLFDPTAEFKELVWSIPGCPVVDLSRAYDY